MGFFFGGWGEKATGEDGEDAEAEEEAGEGGDDPGGGAHVAAPAEPKQAGGEDDATRHDDGEAPFRHGDVVVGLEFAHVLLVCEEDDEEADHDADDEGHVGQARDAQAEAVDLPEDDFVRGEVEVEQAVDEGHVDGDEEDDGFGEEDSQRTRDVLDCELFQVDFDLFLFGMDAPVAGEATKLGGFADEDDRTISFGLEEDGQNARDVAHDGGNISGPSPAKI